MSKSADSELVVFLEEWEETPEKNREVFLHLRDYLTNKEGVRLDFIPRPGVTYSLRAIHPAQKTRELFTMIDVIEDNPRWLSICFYGDMISDPEKIGDFLPEGLLGEDAVCFDLEERDVELIRYIEARLDEACMKASEE